MTNTNRRFEEFKPVLFAALSRLSRQGYGVAPSDAMELMHEFYAHAWSDVEDNFDPDKGDFRGYLYRAFLYFVRPRIVRDRRHREQLMPIEEIEQLERKPEELRPSAIDAHDREVIRKAFDRLSSGDRAILKLRVVDGLSERQVAEQLDMSRYKLRKASARALARLSLEVGESNLSDQTQWAFARRFWGEERSLADASDACGLTVHQGRAMLTTILEMYANNLLDASTTTSSNTNEDTTMMKSQAEEPTSVEHLLRALREDPGNTDLHAQIQEQSEQVEAFLMDSDFELHGPAARELYEALAGRETIDEDLEACYVEALEQDVTSARRAVETSLLPSLPRKLRHPAWVERSGTGCEAIFEMSHALSSVCRRLQRHLEGHEDAAFIITMDSELLDATGETLVSGEALARELHLITELPLEIMGDAIRWFVRAGRSSPALILEAKSSPTHGDMLRIALSSGTAMVRTVFLGDPADPHSTVETRAACRRWNAGLRHLFKNCPNHWDGRD